MLNNLWLSSNLHSPRWERKREVKNKGDRFIIRTLAQGSTEMLHEKVDHVGSRIAAVALVIA